MVRHCARYIGILLLLCGWAMSILDGTRSIAMEQVMLTTLEAAMISLFPTQFSTWPDMISQMVHPFLWTPILTTVLKLPVIPVLFMCGTLLLILGRKQKVQPAREASFS